MRGRRFNVGRVLVLKTPPASSPSSYPALPSICARTASSQGFTLVHFSAQRKRFCMG